MVEQLPEVVRLQGEVDGAEAAREAKVAGHRRGAGQQQRRPGSSRRARGHRADRDPC